MTTTTNPFSNLPAPTGAAVFQDWDDLTTDDPYRYFHGPRAIIPTPHRRCRRLVGRYPTP
ncbi:MAG TPA: hypothetical protein PLI79_05400 [Mycobacterium sp.]|nr:hypothetical protein [Mycobacterium sp.]